MPRYLVDGDEAHSTHVTAARTGAVEVADGQRRYAGLGSTELRRQVTQGVRERTHSQDEPGRGQVGQRLLGLLSEHVHRQ